MISMLLQCLIQTRERAAVCVAAGGAGSGPAKLRPASAPTTPFEAHDARHSAGQHPTRQRQRQRTAQPLH